MATIGHEARDVGSFMAWLKRRPCRGVEAAVTMVDSRRGGPYSSRTGRRPPGDRSLAPERRLEVSYMLLGLLEEGT